MARWLWTLLVVSACSSRDTPAPPPAPIVAKLAPAPPDASDGYDPASLGALAFEVSDGTPEARAHFARGLLALHSFWYDEAIRQFDAALSADPKMRMAYWGAAMSRVKLLWGEDDVATAKLILTRMPDPDGMSPREQAWVYAAVQLLREKDVWTSRKQFAAAMDQVHSQFPDDESATFLSIALLAATRPEDPDNRAVRTRAAELALGVFEHNPKHPGAAHYAIHAYDTPELARLALPVAQQYAQIAPAAFHARHMPAHIFSRLGMWKEAIASCQAAWEASVAAAQRAKLPADHYDFHSLNWLVEMYFELGQRKQADEALARFAQAVRDGLGHAQRTQYAIQVASYLTRTGEWARVDDLLAPLQLPATGETPAGSGAHSVAMSAHCGAPADASAELLEQRAVLDAQALAAAMQHDQAVTRKLLAELDPITAKLHAWLLATQPAPAVAKIDAANARHRRALLAYASRDDRALLEVLRASVPEADLEEAGGETVQRGFLVREQIGEALMRLGKPEEAAAEYEQVLAAHPRRSRALLGSARAAAASRNPRVARVRYEELVQLWANADPGTEALAEAKAATAAK
jgi:tetratricopeptide (TPR) repeat protein